MMPKEQKAIDKLNETNAASLKPSDAIPDRLYHYTSADGFYGIVSSGTLRAGNFSYLNDSSEIEYGRRIVQTVLREYLESTQRPEEREVFARARRTFDDIGQGLEFYLFCFCTKSDRLSQWRAYGSAKGRFCIGFDSENLFTFELRCQLSRVLYDPAEQRRKVKGAIDSAVEALAAGCSPDFIDRVYDLFCRKVTRELSFFKDQGFNEEDEWRVVHPSERADKIEFDVSSGIIKPFVELRASSKGGSGGRLPIAEVIVGPSLFSSLSRKSAELLLVEHGYREVDITEFSVPFRDL